MGKGNHIGKFVGKETISRRTDMWAPNLYKNSYNVLFQSSNLFSILHFSSLRIIYRMTELDPPYEKNYLVRATRSP